MAWIDQHAPSLDDFTALARQAFADLPDDFRKLAGDVVFQITDFADDEVLAHFGIQNPFELSGLYTGVSLADRSVSMPGGLPSMVHLYRLPILDEWADRGDLTLLDLISHVIVHEIGHHFGLTDDDIHAIEDQD